MLSEAKHLLFAVGGGEKADSSLRSE